MYKILIKEIDRYHSKKKGKSFISEYLIYLMFDNTNIETHIEIGESAKKERVNMLLIDTIPNLTQFELEDIIEEITLK